MLFKEELNVRGLCCMIENDGYIIISNAFSKSAELLFASIYAAETSILIQTENEEA